MLKNSTCIKNASLNTHKHSRILLLVFKVMVSQIGAKVLKSFGLVPRAGVEPARPILSYPRILSPEYFGVSRKLSIARALSEKILHQKCINRYSRRLANAPLFTICLILKFIQKSNIKTTSMNVLGGDNNGEKEGAFKQRSLRSF